MSTASGFWIGPDDELDRYELISVLGGGGEGDVWRARSATGAIVAVKIVPGAPDESWYEFGAVIVTLNHPGLTRVVDYFGGSARHRHGARPEGSELYRYLVMEYVDGLPLGQWVADHPDASVQELRRVLRPIAAALDALHDGIGGYGTVVHGDVKPSNIIVTPAGAGVLVDPGLLRANEVAASSGLSPTYAAPELRVPGALATPASDSFAFALSVATAFTGRRPPVDPSGALRTSSVRAWLHVQRMQRRPWWRWRLARAIAASPRRRPTRLRRWLDRPARSISGAFGASVAAVIAVVLVAVISGTRTPHAADSSRQLEAAPGPITTASSRGVEATAASRAARPAPPPSWTTTQLPGVTVAPLLWPFSGGCGAPPPIAGRGAVNPGSEKYIALGSTLSQMPGAGPWDNGDGAGTIVTTGAIHIVDIVAVPAGYLPPPDFVYSYGGSLPGVFLPNVCPTSASREPIVYLNGSLDLDHSGSAPFNATLTPQEIGEVTLSVRSCNGNHAFHLAVDYTVPGSSVVHRRVDTNDTYNIFGLAADTSWDIGYGTQTGSIVLTSQRVSGHDASCLTAIAPRFVEPPLNPAAAATLTASASPPSPTHPSSAASSSSPVPSSSSPSSGSPSLSTSP